VRALEWGVKTRAADCKGSVRAILSASTGMGTSGLSSALVSATLSRNSDCTTRSKVTILSARPAITLFAFQASALAKTSELLVYSPHKRPIRTFDVMCVQPHRNKCPRGAVLLTAGLCRFLRHSSQHRELRNYQRLNTFNGACHASLSSQPTAGVCSVGLSG
jgi:hypothetical protein